MTVSIFSPDWRNEILRVLAGKLSVAAAGSNANGSYIRLSDGTQICRHRINRSSAYTPTAFGSLYLAPSVTWTFPAAFSSEPAVSAMVEADGGRSWATGGGTNLSATSLTFQALQANSNPTATSYSVLAIGPG